MSHQSNSSFSDMSDSHETFMQQMSTESVSNEASERQGWLDYLQEEGFLWVEAMKLIDLRMHLYENVEMRQRLANDCRLHFARWLYEQGELHED